MTRPPPDPILTLKCPSGAVSSLGCFSGPASQPYIMAGTQTGTLHIWNPNDLKVCLSTNVHASSCLSVAPFFPSSPSLSSTSSLANVEPRLITQGRSECIKLWQLASSNLNLLRTFPCGHDAFAAAQADFEVIACPTSTAGEIVIQALNDQAKKVLSFVNVGNVMALKLMPHRHLVAGYESGVIATWDWANEKLISQTQLPANCTPMCLDYEPTTGHVIVGTNTNLHMLSLVSAHFSDEPRREVKTASLGVSSVRFRTDGKLFVSGGWDGRLRYFSSKSLKLLASLNFHQESVSSLLFMPKNSPLPAVGKSGMLVAASSDSWLSFWDLYSEINASN